MNSSAVKFVPLSVMMLCGTPNLKMIDLMKLTAEEAEVEVWDSLRRDQDDYKSVRLILKR